MNTNSWVVCPPQAPSPTKTVESADTAKDMIDALYEEAKNRHDPELMSKVSEIQGLNTGYEKTGHPELAEEIIVKMGQIIGDLLANSSFDPFSALYEKSQTDLTYFLQQQKEFYFMQADGIIEDAVEFVENFDRYLALQGKKEQTRKIYRGKTKMLLKEYAGERTIRIKDLERRLIEILNYRSQDAKKDHNLNSTIRNLLEFISQLQRG